MSLLAKLLVFTMLTFYFTSESAFADICRGDNVIMSGTKSDGEVVSIVLNGDRIKQTPAWDLMSADPPLSISKSVVLALDWVKKIYPESGAVQIESITIRNYGCKDDFDKWYYLISFTKLVDGRRIHEVGNWVVLLMDGSIVAPTITRN
jgi:hypothetical protein